MRIPDLSACTIGRAVESTEIHTAQSYGPYTIQLKGNTLVDFSPCPEKPTGRYWPKLQKNITNCTNVIITKRTRHLRKRLHAMSLPVF